MRTFYLILMLIFTVNGMVQSQTSLKDNYTKWLTKFNEAISIQKEDTLKSISIFNETKRIAQNKLPKHPTAYFFSVNNLYEILKNIDKEKGQKILTETKLFIINKYGSESVFSKIISNSFDNTSHFENNKNSILTTYYNSLNNYFQTLNKEDDDYLFITKEMALAMYDYRNFEFAIYYFDRWRAYDENDVKPFLDKYIYSLDKITNTIYYKEDDLEKYISTLKKIINLNEEQQELDEHYLEDTYKKLILAYKKTGDYESIYENITILKDYYTNKGDDSDMGFAYVNKVLGEYFAHTENLKLSKQFFKQAFRYHDLNNYNNYSDFQQFKRAYFKILSDESETDRLEKVRILKNHMDSFESRLHKDASYIYAVDDYLSASIKNNDTSYELIARLKQVLNYWSERKSFSDRFARNFKYLADIYLSNKEYDKAFSLLNAYRLKLSSLNEKSKHLYKTFALIEFNAARESNATEINLKKRYKRTLEYINSALNYYKKNNTSYKDDLELYPLKVETLFYLGLQNQARKLLIKYKKELENNNLVDSSFYADILMSQFKISKNLDNKTKIEILKRVLINYSKDPSSYSYINALRNYSKLLIINKIYNEPTKNYITIYKFYLTRLEEELRFKSRTSNNIRINKEALNFFAELQYLNYITKSKNKHLNTIAIEASLLSKNLSLNVTSNIKRKMHNLNDTLINSFITSVKKMELKSTSIKEWIVQKEDIYDYELNKPSNKSFKEKLQSILDRTIESQQMHQDSLYALERARKFKKTIMKGYETLMSEYFLKYEGKLIEKINYKDILLKKDEVFIDFNRVKKNDDLYTYMAYIYTSQRKTPQILLLANESLIKNIIKTKSLKSLSYKARGSVGSRNNSGINHGEQLYDLLWQPLEKIVNSYETIYFSLDGELSKIPFSNLQDKQGEILLNKHNLIQLINSIPLVSRDETSPDFDEILAYGGISFGNSTLNDQQGFSYLPGTATEVNKISELFPNIEVRSKNNANENHFRSLSGQSPSIIHIATHGFYFDYEKESKNPFGKQFKASQNPLNRTGLLFSNGNKSMYKKLDLMSNGIDGVLTSQEIAFMDLNNTDLIVLSACETGLGDISGSEGVYGLQRAFKLAGVKLILMSLWQVPDKETEEFMTYFYNQCKETSNVIKSFRATQKHMKYSYPNNPEVWAAFVLVQ